jgi:hypothetical protein
MAFPPLSRLEPVLRSLGLPELTGLDDLGSRGALAYHRLRFAGSQCDLVLARQLWDTGDDPFQRALAAHGVLAAEEMATVSGFRVLPPGSLDRPAALWVDRGGLGVRSGRVSTDRVLLKSR